MYIYNKNIMNKTQKLASRTARYMTLTDPKKQKSIYRTSVNVLWIRNWRTLLHTCVTFVIAGRFSLALNSKFISFYIVLC